MACLDAIKPYFSDKLESLGYKQWNDGFNFENIPSTVLDNSFHVFIPTINGISLNQGNQELEVTTLVRIFRKGFVNVADALNELTGDITDFLVLALLPADRLANPIKNVTFNVANLLELEASNDNAIIVEFDFTVRIILKV